MPRELAERYAEEEGLLFCEASAKSGLGVEEIFRDVGEWGRLFSNLNLLLGSRCLGILL